MANRKPQKNETPRSTKIMRVIFFMFSVLLILTMVLTAFAIPQ
ncbi:MAG: hypothetical protein OZ914_07055 [Anaerolineaceae bacterium]|nr:hypothetical protein [Anaerolineaceae bacterium]GJQ51884.1 MAG: hypothetical protein HKUEN02_07310 [Anaerolineaceae bacterium]HRQ31896.1 hypothetical protein [Anaerolineales bacterium]